jgi:hypothetical protein
MVLQEIDSYIYQHHPAAVGTPMPQEWVTQQLAAMREAFVEPVLRLIEIRDTEQLRGDAAPLMRECALVADDNEGYDLYLSPASNDFVLAYSRNPPSTFNVRGDAVECLAWQAR